jgi:hypothetical protein
VPLLLGGTITCDTSRVLVSVHPGTHVGGEAPQYMSMHAAQFFFPQTLVQSNVLLLLLSPKVLTICRLLSPTPSPVAAML